MAGFLSVSLRRVFFSKSSISKMFYFLSCFTNIALNYESCDSLLLMVYNRQILRSDREYGRDRLKKRNVTNKDEKFTT